MSHSCIRHLVDKAGRHIIIRPAAGVDAERVLTYNQTIIRSEPYLLTTPEEFTITAEQERMWIEETQHKDNHLILLAEHEEQLVGFLSFHGGPKSRIAHTGSFSVSTHQDYRGSGIGRALMEVLIDWARAHDRVAKLKLEVFEHNQAAILLYRSLGFMEEGVLRHEIRLEDGSYADLIAMALFVKDAPQ